MDASITNWPQEPAPAVVAQVAYHHDPDDYVEGYLFVWEKSLRRQIHKGYVALGVYAALFLILTAAAVWLPLNGMRDPLFLIVPYVALATIYCLLVAQAYMVIVPLRKHFSRAHYRKLIEKQRRAGLFRTNRRDVLSMTAAGFTEVNDSWEADGGVRIVERKEFEVQWSAVETIDETERLAIFTVTRKGYLFLPRWAFKNEDEFLGFVETARQLWRGEHSAVPLPDGRLQAPP